MTPAELISRRLMARLEAAGVSVPVQSLLIQALAGETKSVASSGVLVNCHISEQIAEPLPNYKFDVIVRLVVSIDDDKNGELFAENYAAIWAAFDYLAREDNCEELGDENDHAENDDAPEPQHVFAVDGFQLGGGDEPDYQEDENGGTWTTSFTATLTGRAN